MELMSSLLLCALAAALPQALGEASNSRLRDVIILLKPNATQHKQILLNMNAPPLVSPVTEMQSVFKDLRCTDCLNCMERAIKAYIKHISFKTLHEKYNVDELFYKVVNESHNLHKRSINITKTYGTSKSRATKSNRGVTVTKYSDENGKVYALKVKELNLRNETIGKKYTCKAYSVAETLPCDMVGLNVSGEGPKKKVKRDKKSKHKTSTSKVTEPKTTPFYSKREIYNSDVPESYMPSVEDMY